MLNIILCDDDPFILRLGAEKIERIVEQKGCRAQIAMAQTGGELVAFVKNNPGECLVFLDLDFGEGRLNGIDIAKRLRREGGSVKVVFVTNHREMAMDVLKSGAEPFGFREKSADIVALSEGYRKYIDMALRSGVQTPGREDMLTLALDMGETLTIAKSEILYVEAEKNVSHGITYHTLGGSNVTILGTLDAQQQHLGDGFVRIHRAYLVQGKYMLSMKDGYVKLSTQEELPCSLRRRGEVRKWIDRKS